MSGQPTTKTLLLLNLLFVAGCVVPVPVLGKAVTSREVCGRILRKADGNPITGAKIMVHERPETAGLTDEKGEFRIQKVQELFLMRFVTPWPVYYWPPMRARTSLLDVSHPDCLPVQLNLWEHWDMTRTNVVGTVFLMDELLLPKDNPGEKLPVKP